MINYHPIWFNSITFDNGAEFARLAQLRHTKIYFAHPTHLEKNSNENCNGLLRQFCLKGQPINQSRLYLHQASKATPPPLSHRSRMFSPMFSFIVIMFLIYLYKQFDKKLKHLDTAHIIFELAL